jgi:hypothetical protein
LFLAEINNKWMIYNRRHARSGLFPYPYSANVADGPNVLTGEHEMLYLTGRCAAVWCKKFCFLNKYTSERLKWYFKTALFSTYFLLAFFAISRAFGRMS